MNITIPITITKVSPVRLVSINASENLCFIGVEYSDGSRKLLSNAAGTDTYSCYEDGSFYFEQISDCSESELSLSSDHVPPAGYELIPYRAYINSCSMNGDAITGNLVIQVDNAIFIYNGWLKDAGEDFVVNMDNFDLQ